MKSIVAKLIVSFEENKVIPFLFNILFFVTPLIFLPFTSELFEFNKLVVVYIVSTLIVASWLASMVFAKKIIFRRTILDIPLVLFLLSQILSTVFSIDRYTSLFGYYSRFNGGLLSIICYVFLYWAFVSNMSSKATKRLIGVLFISTVLVSIWAILEHFGISPSCVILRGEWNTDCWVQDVRARVFATLGQPNWLAAFVVSVMPLSWALSLSSKLKNKKSTLDFKNKHLRYFAVSMVLFLALLFTRSRSAILAFAAADLSFWLLVFLFYKKKYFSQLKNTFLLFNISFAILIALAGTPWTPNISQIINPQPAQKAEIVSESGNVIELDGTESGTLRTIVWRGALDIWRNYPLLGSGVETFAYSYFAFRPIEHNQTSEWDFLYNKAHNEFLNFAANSGSVGILTYMAIIAVFFVYVGKQLRTQSSSSKGIFDSSKIVKISILSAFISMLVTNFFGFSVVITSLGFFLLPAMVVVVKDSRVKDYTINKITNKQKILLSCILLTSTLLLTSIAAYWYADTLFAYGRRLLETTNTAKSRTYLEQAANLNPHIASYHDTLANSYAQLGLLEEDASLAKVYAQKAKDESDRAYALAPRNINLLKSRSNLFVDLGQIDPNYVVYSIETLQDLFVLAPTDPSVYYRMGLSLISAGHNTEAVSLISEAIRLKPDYKRARQALSYLYQQQSDFDKAREQLQYILDHISPDDTSVKQQLQDLELIKGAKSSK